MKKVDVAIVGAGIVGLAHALAAARRGFSVVLFERHERALGASIRNFGLIWPVGQPIGPLQQRALRSAEIWRELAERVPLYVDSTGSLHLAYHEDEQTVLEEFLAGDNAGRALWTPGQVAARTDAVRMDGLRAALWSSTELTVDPREAIRRLPVFLEKQFGVQLRFGTAINGVNFPNLETKDERWSARHIFVCGGADFETLYPREYAASGITRCKLQMMRTPPQPRAWRLGPSLCAGLTLTHYASFRSCPSLPAVRDRFRRERPFAVENGIHVLVSQTEAGALTIGDSHHYGLALNPFDSEAVNAAILDYFQTFTRVPSLEIVERWHGIYPKMEGKTEWIIQPEPGVTIVNALSGAGMTLSFGLAEENVAML